MSDFDSFIDSLIETPAPIKVKAKSRAVTFPCGQCGGTGLYQGARVHQEKSHCFACRGTGSFKTDPRKLAANREKAAMKRRAEADVKAGLIADFAKEHPAMYAELKGAHINHDYGYGSGGATNDFIVSLAGQFFSKGQLSDKQIAAWYRGKEKLEAKKLEREAARPTVDLGRIEELFAKVQERGAKKPAYYADGLRLSLAPAAGVNAGAIYIKDEQGTYLGKVKGSRLSMAYEAKAQEATVAAKLQVIAMDPLDAAIKYGKKTGVCACCGRELTDPVSIARGIGPICEDKWF